MNLTNQRVFKSRPLCFVNATNKTPFSVKQHTIREPCISVLFVNCIWSMSVPAAVMQTAQLSFKLALRTCRLKILCYGYIVVTLQGFPSMCCQLRAFYKLLTGSTENVTVREHVFSPGVYNFQIENANKERTISFPTYGLI